jgi:hypothetical protein
MGEGGRAFGRRGKDKEKIDFSRLLEMTGSRDVGSVVEGRSEPDW